MKETIEEFLKRSGQVQKFDHSDRSSIYTEKQQKEFDYLKKELQKIMKRSAEKQDDQVP